MRRETTDQPDRDVRQRVPEPPTGWTRLKWMAPGLLWMSSAVGSGAVLFTPRVGARYQFAFLWLALLVIFLMWIMIREAGRYSVDTGQTLLEGYARLPGPANWAVWLIYLPQLAAAVAGVGGLAALVGSALHESAGGPANAWACGAVTVLALLVVTGQYKGVERACQLLAVVLMGIAVVAAVKVFDSGSQMAAGLIPSRPEDFDFYFILPWVGTILAGSMGRPCWSTAAACPPPYAPTGPARPSWPSPASSIWPSLSSTCCIWWASTCCRRGMAGAEGSSSRR